MDGQPCDFTGETFMERFIMRFMYAFGKLFPSILICIPFVAYADGRPVIERMDYVCGVLGYERGCKLEYERGRYLAEVTVTVDEDVTEPGVFVPFRISAGSILIRFPHLNVSMSEVIMPTEDAFTWYDQLWMKIYGDAHPCLTVGCPELREENPGSYDGVSETDLTDTSRIKEKLPFQVADDALVAIMQKELNTTGLPLITKVKSIKLAGSNVSNDSATVIRAIVTIRVAKYAK